MQKSKKVNYCLLLTAYCLLSFTGCNRPPEGMVLIPEGDFIMGSNIGEQDEGPEKKVSLKAFYIDKFEITNEAYKQFVTETKHREPKSWAISGYKEEEKSMPVVFVGYSDASEYCKWRGKRLPAEQEWEKAARGTDGRIYPWGNEFDSSKANTSLSGMVGTTNVGTYDNGKSPYSIYEMAGNVWEWTNSNYDEKRKVVKGGSWGLSHRFARTFTRIGYKNDARINNLGFRCAKDK
ncbi:MAG: SUMF1/EgtB/PvdO family nonheme iron enzyme [Deltaproteobacteria bacterium]|nr:SUMF1/EgtB/PvdO family nonheme iron enzyme [Deltaproteobacteria bacterium]